MSDTAYVTVLPDCDLCRDTGTRTPAAYDASITIGGRSTWANVCETHFALHGHGLGTGRGQRLVVGEKPEVSRAETRAAIMAAVESGDFDAAEDLVGDGDLTEWL